MHKLTAGSGYDYLTRQVAAMDSTEKGHVSLASYYSEKGEIPGQWKGRGLAGLGDIAIGDVVTADQMQNLFGAGYHPNMESRLNALPDGATPAQLREAARLGQPFKVYSAATDFHIEVAERCRQWLSDQGLDSRSQMPVDVKAGIINELATARFRARVGRAPSEEELSSEVTRLAKHPTTACAGYDVTFTPVKSVSALWAVAPVPVAAAIEQAHNAAVEDALRYLEDHALYSRCGAGGVRQVDVRGMVAAAFVHRDSRAGDPNLHTHVAIANKVQTEDGKWLAIDGRLIFQAMVSVSETYNSQLEAHLARELGVSFRERSGDDPLKRPVREVVGVPSQLVEGWSSRRAAIEARQAELIDGFQESHGRPPTPAEAIRLAQQATLETRDAKHEPRSLTEQRAIWGMQADQVLGAAGVEEMIQQCIPSEVIPSPASPSVDELDGIAEHVVEVMSQSRARWQVWHLRAEASRQLRGRVHDPDLVEQFTNDVVRRAQQLSIELGSAVEDGLEEPDDLRRADGTSMYRVVGRQMWTSAQVIAAEERLTDLAGREDGRRVEEPLVSLALLESTANGVVLNAGQAELVRQLTMSGRRVQLALAPAGSGKTTALGVLTRAWEESGGQVLGLAPSAVAAAVLRDHTRQATTIAKLLWDLRNGRRDDVDAMVGPDTLIIIDESGMADTVSLAAVAEYALERGASVRLVGDDQQLASIGAGGVLRDIATTHGAATLAELVRFTDPAEAAASLALREGHIEALGFYLDRDRVHPGSSESVLETALTAWIRDTQAGNDSIMLASTRDEVAQLNRQARQHRLDGTRPRRTVELADGNHASVGDTVLTRRNTRRLAVSATDWVKNGDRWIVEKVSRDGSLRVRHHTSGLHATLPAEYVNAHTQLGYASTVHTAQGISVDTTHTVISGRETRQLFYVAMTRGRSENHVYLPVLDDIDEHYPVKPQALNPSTAVEILESVLARDGAARSASTELREVADPRPRLAAAVERYSDALAVAAESVVEDAVIQKLEDRADQVVPQITSQPAWPTLRARLIMAAVDGQDPLQLLKDTAARRELGTSEDPAATITWRLGPEKTGPLPWLPEIPPALAQHPEWGAYLTARRGLVETTAADVRSAEHDSSWLLPDQEINTDLVGEVEIWRTATGVEPTDRRPLGPRPVGAAPQQHHDQLQRKLDEATSASPWTTRLRDRRELRNDPWTTQLAQRLTQLEDQHVPVNRLTHAALENQPLPSQHAAAALWWRITNQIAATPPGQADQPWWSPALVGTLGTQAAAALESSAWWPALVAAAEQAVEQGCQLENLIPESSAGFEDPVQAMLWRIQLQLADAADEAPPTESDPTPDDIANGHGSLPIRMQLDELEREDRERRHQLWADAINPGLVSAPQWPSIDAHLTQLESLGIDTNRAITRLRGVDPSKIEATLRRIHSHIVARPPAADRSANTEREQRGHLSRGMPVVPER